MFGKWSGSEVKIDSDELVIAGLLITTEAMIGDFIQQDGAASSALSSIGGDRF